MVEQACLASLRAKFHVGGMTWADFTHVYLESCTWRMAIFTMDQRNEQRVCIKFCANLGKSATETLEMIQQGFGDQSLSLLRCFNRMPGLRPVAHQLTMTNTQGDPQVAQLLKLLHEFKSSFVRIDVWPFATLLRRWKLVMGHANRFWRKNWACTVSQPNLCPGSWQLTRSSSASTSALNFVSSPPTMKRSCLGSSLPWFGTLWLLPIS